MAIRNRISLTAILSSLLPLVLAQNVATITDGSTTTANTASPTQTTSTDQDGNPILTPTDGAPRGNDNDDTNSTGIVHYYFLFIAVILCGLAICMFMFFRRRRRAMMHMHYGRESGMHGRPHHGPPWGRGPPWARGRPGMGGDGRYWHGRWGSPEHSRNEGLNEFGDAPPPYVPKTPEEERRAREGHGEADESQQPSIPLQTLSRNDAGLKPPDYSETHTSNDAFHMRPRTVDASSSRLPDTERSS